MSMINDLMGQLDGGGISEISRQLGIDESKVSQVVAGAIPAMVTGLANNSATTAGRDALASAIDRDHNGSIMDDMMGFLGGGAGGGAGAGILRHVLGGRQASVNQALGGASGLDSNSVQQILAMVAPFVINLRNGVNKPRYDFIRGNPFRVCLEIGFHTVTQDRRRNLTNVFHLHA